MRHSAAATLAVTAVLLLSGCARFGGLPSTGGPSAAAGLQTQQAVAATKPGAATPSAGSTADLGGFVDPKAVKQLSEKDKAEAASAQFYALQFGRPGAPRVWQGDSGASGKVLVGPFVRVNELDCREFSHLVEAKGQSYTRAGTACRETNGNWSVVDVS